VAAADAQDDGKVAQGANSWSCNWP
jgi:hypothetical protein